MYERRAFDYLWRFIITHPAVLVRYRNEWCDDGLSVAFAQVALDRYCRNGTNRIHFSSLTEQSQLFASLKQTVAALATQLLYAVVERDVRVSRGGRS